MLRNLLAIPIGIAVGMAVNMAFVSLNVSLFPMPEGVSFEAPEGMAAYMATLPIAAFALILVAHLGQAFVGGWVAARLSTRRPLVNALIVGALSMIAGLLNMLNMPLPAWMWVEMPLYLVAAWGAGRLELWRRAR